MDWIEGLYEKAENKWKRMSLKKAMVLYIPFVFLFVAVAYFLTVRICETEIDMLRSLYFNSAVKTSAHTIEITYTPKQEPGGETQTTLVFKAYAGLSGRHCDPMQDTGFLHHPSARTELPAYGCGGYGGHGGGGGAGAGTVVIRKFTSGNADNVEQIAISMRHGYGSGGAAGGQGGDVCVLIFW